jgi:hypothetical protein
MRRRLVLLSLLVLAAALGATGSAHASSTQLTMFEAPRELLSPDDALRAQTFAEIDGFGVRWLRVIVYWRNVAPQPDSRTVPGFDETNPAAYGDAAWAQYDRVVHEARARGMNLLLTVTGPVPRWATHDRNDQVTRPSPTHFRRFMTAIARRYGSDVKTWAIWNEPNHPDFLRPQYTGSGRSKRPASPAIYRGLLQAGITGLRDAGQGADRVLMGETAPRGTGNVVSPLKFLRGASCLSDNWKRRSGCKQLAVDGYAHHAYTTTAGPWYRPPQPNDVTIGTIDRLVRALDRAANARALPAHLPIWLTEFGVQSEPDPYLGVSFAKQAEYRSISEYYAYRQRRVRAFSQYLMRDDEPRAGAATGRYSGFESGLRTAEGATKPAYESFRLPLMAKRRSRDVFLWGLVRPHNGVEQVTTEYRNRGSSTWRRLKHDSTNNVGYWSTTTLDRGRTYRVRWTDAAGKTHVGPATRAYSQR